MRTVDEGFFVILEHCASSCAFVEAGGSLSPGEWNCWEGVCLRGLSASAHVRMRMWAKCSYSRAPIPISRDNEGRTGFAPGTQRDHKEGNGYRTRGDRMARRVRIGSKKGLFALFGALHLGVSSGDMVCQYRRQFGEREIVMSFSEQKDDGDLGIHWGHVVAPRVKTFIVRAHSIVRGRVRRPAFFLSIRGVQPIAIASISSLRSLLCFPT